MANLTATSDPQALRSKAWRVLIFGIISNFSIGILYSWGNLKQHLEYAGCPPGVTAAARAACATYASWDITQLSWPYSYGGFISALIVVIAGPLQDKIGPTKVMIAGILMVGGGTMLCSLFTQSPLMFTIVFTIFVGNGIGFVYACPRPAAMKWFHPSKKGMVNGFVVAGFGLGAMWLGPLEVIFLNKLGWTLEFTLLVLGGLILCMGLPAAMNVVNPPEGYPAPGFELPGTPPPSDKPLKENQKKTASIKMGAAAKKIQTWQMFLIYSFYCSAGAMVISNAPDIMKIHVPGGTENPIYGSTVAFMLNIMVMVASLSNATGRSMGGILSDKIGRKPTYYLIHTVQAINMAFFHTYHTPTAVFLGTIVTCVAYGTVMSTTPSLVADYFGLKNYGGIYGIVYTGWGVSLIIGPTISQFSKKLYGNYNLAYYSAIGLIAISAVSVFFLKKPKFKQSEVADDFVLAPEDRLPE